MCFGGEEWGVLTPLGDVPPRHTRNAAFLKLEEYDAFSDSRFYEDLLTHVSAWLQELKEKQML